MKNVNSVLAAAFAIALSGGCASIVSRDRYDIPLHANEPALVEIRSGDELKTVVTAPATVTLDSGAGFFTRAKYTFTFKKDGYPDVVKKRNAYLNGWYFGNIIFGGLIGILIVDPATGAMWRLDENPLGVQYNMNQSN